MLVVLSYSSSLRFTGFSNSLHRFSRFCRQRPQAVGATNDTRFVSAQQEGQLSPLWLSGPRCRAGGALCGPCWGAVTARAVRGVPPEPRPPPSRARRKGPPEAGAAGLRPGSPWRSRSYTASPDACFKIGTPLGSPSACGATSDLLQENTSRDVHRGSSANSCS